RLAQWRRSRSVRDESGESTSVARTADARSSRRRPNRWPRRAERSSPPSRGYWSWRAWAIRIGAVIELADEFDWAFKGVEMAIAMIADMHHAPARGAIPIQHVKFPESEVGVGWPAVGHRIDLRGVPVG